MSIEDLTNEAAVKALSLVAESWLSNRGIEAYIIPRLDNSLLNAPVIFSSASVIGRRGAESFIRPINSRAFFAGAGLGLANISFINGNRR